MYGEFFGHHLSKSWCSKSNWLHVVNFQVFFVHYMHILFKIIKMSRDIFKCFSMLTTICLHILNLYLVTDCNGNMELKLLFMSNHDQFCKNVDYITFTRV